VFCGQQARKKRLETRSKKKKPKNKPTKTLTMMTNRFPSVSFVE
jgi:hypothetical protein